MFKKAYITAYALLLLFGGSYLALAMGLGDAGGGIMYRFGETFTYKLYRIVGMVTIYLGMGSVFGLLWFGRWARKLAIFFNIAFMLTMSLRIFFDRILDCLLIILFLIPLCIFFIWYFSHPSVKLLFEEANRKSVKGNRK